MEVPALSIGVIGGIGLAAAAKEEEEDKLNGVGFVCMSCFQREGGEGGFGMPVGGV